MLTRRDHSSRPRARLLSDHGRSVLLTVVPLALAVLSAVLAGTL